MTISIGFICKNSIVLAVDCQGSFEGITHKKTNIDKLVEVQFVNGYAVCVMADDIECFETFREFLETRAAKTRIRAERSIPDAVEQAIRDHKIRLRQLALPEQRAGLTESFSSNSFEMVLGFFFQGTPYLYYGNFAKGRMRRIYDDYCMIGAPHQLVDYIMADLPAYELSDAEGISAAAYVIQMAKNHDSSCGGITRMALIEPASPHILAQDEILPFVHAASTYEAGNQKTWPRLVAESVARTPSVAWLLPPKPHSVPAALSPSSAQRPPSPKRGRKRPPASRE